MYVGRFLVAAPGLAAYRVSSRSFPNRKVIARDGSLTVVPTDDAEPTDNPYVSYNCVRTVDDRGLAVVGNGSHVDPVAEKLGLGYPARDALVSALFALDFEKDDPEPFALAADGAAAAASELYDHAFEHAVCAAGVSVGSEGIETAIHNGE